MALVGAMDYEPGKAVGSSSGYSNSKKTTTTSKKKTTSSSKSSIKDAASDFVQPGIDAVKEHLSNTVSGTMGGYSDPTVDIYALYQERLAKQQAAAQASYERNINAINNAYGSARNYYDSNLESTKNTLKASYDASKSDIDSDAEASLREAYINNMLNRKNLQQALTAQGLNGGASETTQASMLNNYGTARNEIEKQQADNLAELLQTYNNNLSSAQNAWSSQMASLELQKMQQLQQAENALNSLQTASLGNISTDSSYLTALQSLMNAQNAYDYAPTETSLLQQLISSFQADAQADVYTNNNKYEQQQALTNAATNAGATVTAQNIANAINALKYSM